MQELLNIISDSYNRNIVNGPKKVIINTIKGLTKIGYPFEINKDIRDFRYNWIHDSIGGLIEAGLNRTPVVVGPNIANLPKDLPRFRPALKNCIYLHPSQWCVDLWKELGFSECQMYSWPVGIDTEDFNVKRDITNSSDIMVYYKRQDPILLYQTITLLKNMNLVPKVIKFGDYNEDHYKQILSKSKLGIWIGISESQGIGLQEALASDLPLIVYDCNSLFEGQNLAPYKFPENLRTFKTTSVPYFDESCGIILKDFSQLEKSIQILSDNLKFYTPRKFVNKNLSLEKQANELLSFFDLLDYKRKYYFKNGGYKKKNEIFKLSLRGTLVYWFFVLTRKTKTMFRILQKGNKIIGKTYNI